MENHYLILGFLTSFIGVFLKGFQLKNVNGNHYKLIALTSYLMAFTDVISIGLVAKNGWIMALPVGTGAALGMILAIYLHNKYIT